MAVIQQSRQPIAHPDSAQQAMMAQIAISHRRHQRRRLVTFHGANRRYRQPVLQSHWATDTLQTKRCASSSSTYTPKSNRNGTYVFQQQDSTKNWHAAKRSLRFIRDLIRTSEGTNWLSQIRVPVSQQVVCCYHCSYYLSWTPFPPGLKTRYMTPPDSQQN